MRPVRQGPVPGVPVDRHDRPGDTGGSSSAQAIQPVLRPRPDHRADPADPGRGRLAVPAVRGGRQRQGHRGTRYAGPAGLVHRWPRRRYRAAVRHRPAALPDRAVARPLPARAGTGAGQQFHVLADRRHRRAGRRRGGAGFGGDRLSRAGRGAHHQRRPQRAGAADRQPAQREPGGGHLAPRARRWTGLVSQRPGGGDPGSARRLLLGTAAVHCGRCRGADGVHQGRVAHG